MGDATRGAIASTLRELKRASIPTKAPSSSTFPGADFEVGTKFYLAPGSASANDFDREGLAVEEVEQLMGESKAASDHGRRVGMVRAVTHNKRAPIRKGLPSAECERYAGVRVS